MSQVRTERLQTSIRPLPPAKWQGCPVRCWAIRFRSCRWQGQNESIFGYYALPTGSSGRVPGLLLVHGGGGYATLDRVVEGAGRGFGTLAIDLPGKGTNRERFSRSTGPDMTVRQIFTTAPHVEDAYIYHAVLAEMSAVTFLSTRPEIDPKRIGMVGVSWGGATGLLTAAIDDRLRCFVDLFGSGYLREGSAWIRYLQALPPRDLDLWEANYDASRYVRTIHIPVLAVTGTNDGCYWLPQFMKTMRGIHPSPDLLLLPNLNHRVDSGAREAFFRWLQQHLTGAVSVPPRRGLLMVRGTPGSRSV